MKYYQGPTNAHRSDDRDLQGEHGQSRAHETGRLPAVPGEQALDESSCIRGVDLCFAAYARNCRHRARQKPVAKRPPANQINAPVTETASAFATEINAASALP